MMNKVVEIQDFSIVVVADNQSPSILNPDFLKYNHIVPAQWELAMPPICTPPVSQVVFKNGVNIVAQSDGVTFWEGFEPDNFSVEVPEVAYKYIEVLPYIGYRAIGLNFTGHVVIDKHDDLQNFILNKLIASGSWKNFQGNSPHVSIKFTYPMENGYLTIAVEEGGIQDNPNTQLLPVLIFEANFHRDISDSTNQEKTSQVKKYIQNWKIDFNTFKSLVEETFLG